MLVSQQVVCPSCWENIEVELDLSGEDQDYIEDCSVCCRPMRIRYQISEGSLAAIDVESAV